MTSWLAHDPPINGLDPSIVVQLCRLHVILGVMTLATEQEQEKEHDLAAAARLLVALAPRIRAVFARPSAWRKLVMGKKTSILYHLRSTTVLTYACIRAQGKRMGDR